MHLKKGDARPHVLAVQVGMCHNFSKNKIHNSESLSYNKIRVNLRAVFVDSCGGYFGNCLTSSLMENIQTFNVTDTERGTQREDLRKQHNINTNVVIP